MTTKKKVNLYRPVLASDSVSAGADGTPSGRTGGTVRRAGANHKQEEVFARLILPPNVELISQRWTSEGWSGTFRYFGQEEFVLRERRKGSIECEYRPYNRVKGELSESKRRRTGSKSIDAALNAALLKFIHPEHEKRVISGPATQTKAHDGTPAPIKDPGFEDIAILIRSLDLTHISTKQRSHEERILDLSCAIWGNKPQNLLGSKDIEEFYRVRRAGFRWPKRFSHRRRLAQNPKPITIQKELETLRTVINRLIGENHPRTGQPYIQVNRLEQLDLGSYAKAQRSAAHQDRYNWVFHAADQSVEIIREQGIDRSFFREDRESGDRVFYKRRRLIRDVVPGITRIMLVLQYGHGMRPGSWRHIDVEQDVALDVLGVRNLIRSLRLLEYDERIPQQWAREWPAGAIAYRKEYLKGKHDRRYERIVPLSERMRSELSLYLSRRKAWLEELGVTSRWLLPNPSDPAQPISDSDARALLYAAEELARKNAAEQRGEEYADEVLEDLEDTAWYAYRRAWKTLRHALGWHENKNANYCGGWSTKVGQISEVVYARLLPKFMLAVVEGLSVVEAVRRYGETEELRMSVDVAPDRLPGPGA